MKTTLLATLLLVGLLTLGGVLLSHNASAALSQDVEESRKGKAEVVIIICQLVGTGTPIGSPPYNVTVAGVSHSAGGPAVQVGGECAQALASVMSSGFRLRDAEVLNVGGVQYTLVD